MEHTSFGKVMRLQQSIKSGSHLMCVFGFCRIPSSAIPTAAEGFKTLTPHQRTARLVLHPHIPSTQRKTGLVALRRPPCLAVGGCSTGERCDAAVFGSMLRRFRQSGSGHMSAVQQRV